MSVIVEEMSEQNSRILLLTKGADEVILSRLVKDSLSQAKEKEVITKALYGYAC
jgi:magnesium-transporting ATPase (P-type)